MGDSIEIGHRFYRVLPILKKDENIISGDTLKRRYRRISLTEEGIVASQESDRLYLMKHQADIPEEYHKVILIFMRDITNQHPKKLSSMNYVAYVYYSQEHKLWFNGRLFLNRHWHARTHILVRVG